MRTRLIVGQRSGDPDAEIAARLDIEPSTWRSYVARGQAPPPDGYFDRRTPWWWSTTVDRWDRKRPSKSQVS